jgi:phage gpG-like protein
MFRGGVIIDDQLTERLKQIDAAGRNLTPAMAEISGELVKATKLNFEGEHDPLGVPWKKVLNPPDFRTILRRTSDLFESIEGAHGADFAKAGPEKSGGAGIYAAAHQFGARITASKGKALKTPFGPRKAVVIPARPYLGWNDVLRRDALDIVADHLKGVGKPGEAA